MKHPLSGILLLLAFSLFIPFAHAQTPNPGDIIINEFVATNMDGLPDKDGDYEDWLELKNITGSSLSLSGLYLSDATDDLLKWQFPNISLAGGDHLLIFASGKNVTDVAELHTNFKIDREGEYLALVTSASTVIDDVTPLFPLQHPGYSYGWDSGSGQLRYLEPPTPGADNGTSTALLGFLQDEVQFSATTGLFDDAFNLTLSYADAQAEVYYTTDGATPTKSSTPYTSPIWIEDLSIPGPPLIPKGPVIRARAFRSGYVPSAVGSQTYLVGLPDKYKSLPIVSVITAPDNLVGPYGILDNTYCNAPWQDDDVCSATCCPNMMGRGRAWERPSHVEWFNDEPGVGFKADCGLRLHASGSARPNVFPEYHASFRLYFREDYGVREIPNTVFRLSRVPTLSRMVLRKGKNDPSNPFIRDEFMRRSFGDTGQASAVGDLTYLFLNGELGKLGGYYNPCERLDDTFMMDHHGGSDNWDVIRSGLIGDGSDVYWKELNTYSTDANGMVINVDCEKLATRLDLTNYIDYLLVNIYGSTHDWPRGNYAASTDHVPDWMWRFYIWDAEWAMEQGGYGEDTIEHVLDGSDPDTRAHAIPRLYQSGVQCATFRHLFAEEFRNQFYGNGAMTDSNLRARWEVLMDKMSEAIPEMTSKWHGSDWSKFKPKYMNVHLFEKDLLEPLNELEPSVDSPLRINEFMALNNSTIQDGEGEFEDWIEIYNNSSSAVDLSGMYLSDNFSIPLKWQFPAGTTIDPFDFLLVWADGDAATAGGLHTNFQLAGDGEEIGLYDTDANGNVLLDSVVFTKQTADTSMGRRPDGAGGFQELPTASPGASNGSVPPTSEPGDYWVRSNLQVGQGLRDVAVGDLDKDGTLDMVATDHDFGRVAVLLNGGVGTRTFSGPQYYSNALGNKGVALGDLNNDGHLDIVTANDRLVDYNISTLLNNGDGTFGSPSFYALYSLVLGATDLQHPHAVAIADLNGDGFEDVIISNESAGPQSITGQQSIPNLAHVYFNAGGGSGTLVSPPQKLTMGLNEHDHTGTDLVAEDMDGDTDIDIVALTHFKPLSISTNQGNGTFAAAGSISGSWTRSVSLASGDFDLDGDIDIVGVGGTILSTFLNAGDGTFPTVSNLNAPSGRYLETVATVDVDGDGYPDLVVPTQRRNAKDSPGVAVYLNNGDGSFRFEDQGVGFPQSADNIIFPDAIRSGDFDGDGAMDVVVADGVAGDLVVFYNETEAPPPAPTPTPDPASVPDWNQY